MSAHAWAYRYDSHGLWSQLDDSRYALENAGPQENEAAELNRQQLVAAFGAASGARSALGPFVTLAELDSALNQVATYFTVDSPTQNLASQQVVTQALQHLRVLPPPLPRAAASAVSGSVAALRKISERDVRELEVAVADLSQRTLEAESRLDSVSTAASEQQALIAGESARLQQTVAGANARFDAEIELVRSEWATKRAEQERELTGALAYTFIQEVSRASAADRFSVGDSLLRISLVGTLGAAIAYLFAESGRRRREANSAEEVATVLNTVEAFTATSPRTEQEALAKEISRMVFVENIRSRLNSRDSARGGSSNATMEQLLELAGNLAKSSASVTKR